MRIVYNSFHGRYSDSPRAVFERLADRGGLEQIWLVDPDHAHGFPAEARTVDIGSREATAVLESADVLIASSHTEVPWSKSARTTYLQTWHGTPLKRIHRDVRWAPEGRLDRLDGDVALWDVLVSPNAASTPRLRSGFRYTGEVLEIGYPRNDLLSSPEAGEVRERVRSELGVADGETAVLYAPTWRDDELFGDGPPQVDLPLDIPALVGAVGSQLRVLVRAHPLMTAHTRVPSHPAVVDVSFHPDVRDLYLAADVLVTDYSSTMFDFAVTGRPILQLVHDLERFESEVRGFYFDPLAAAPGPVVRTVEELATELSDPQPGRRHADAYAAFVREFCALEDGHATDRLLARLGL